MAEQNTSNVGHDSTGEPGDSMRGVTGRESIFALDAFTEDPVGAKLFDLPVDSEHKAKKIKLFSVAAPHMRAFHISWFSFFVSFCSAFAAPPLLPIIRDNLNLNKIQIGHAGIATVVGAILSRIVMGTVCDLVGPRFGAAFLLMGTVPCVASMAAVHEKSGFIIARLFIGFVLATFVSTQYWMSSMFNSKIVGVANGTTAGWGNLGGGAIQLIMPLVYDLIKKCGAPSFRAWRIAFFIPATFQIIAGLLVLAFGQDSPDGQYISLSKSGQRKIDQPQKVILNGLLNYRTWVLVLTYGYCFGVELTVDNVIAQYYFDKFDLNINTAGLIGASFGLMNIFSRPLGGILSDVMANQLGMRGRLWNLWVLQTLAGTCCVILGRANHLSFSIVMLIVFSYFCQAACGATFGIVPFISRRSLGIISGITGAGGNAGSAITQALFFTSVSYSTDDGITYMGYMIIACTLPVFLIYFPQWGGMLLPPSKAPTATEEMYYLSEYNETEQSENMHVASLKFAQNAKSERGRRNYEENEFDAPKKADIV